MPDELIPPQDAPADATATDAATPQEPVAAPAAPAPAAAPAKDWEREYRALEENYRSTMYGIGENLKRVADVDPRLKFITTKHPSDWDADIQGLAPKPEPPKPPQGVTPEMEKWLQDRDRQVFGQYENKIADLEAWRSASVNEKIADVRTSIVMREMDKYDNFKHDAAFEMVRPVIAQRVRELNPQTVEQYQAIVKDVHDQYSTWQTNILEHYAREKGKQRAGTPPPVTAGGGQPAPNQPPKQKVSIDDGSATRALQNQIDTAHAAK